MRRGLGWTFHAWGHSGALYLDSYQEERPGGSASDSRLVGKHYEYDSGLNQQTKRYYVGGRLVATRSGTTLRYVQPDYLGSTATLTNESGSTRHGQAG